MFKRFLNRTISAFTSKIISSLENIIVGIKTINNNFAILMKFLMKQPDKEEEKICDYEDYNEAKVYRGYGVKINDYIAIRQPTVDEVVDYGDNKYYGMVQTLCSVGADLKWQLDDMNIDYTKIPDYDLFCFILARGFNVDKTKILFGDVLDFSKMQLMFNTKLQENVLIQAIDEKNCIQIDRAVYKHIVDVLRKMHKLKRNDEVPGNESTRQILIEDARDEYEENKNKPIKSYLLPLMSTLANSAGSSHNEKTVGQIKIYAFMDSIARISKIKNAELLLQSGYSGFGVNLKDIDKNEINYMGDL